MATSTLAQDALYLKQLDQILKETYLLHQDINNTLHVTHKALQTLEKIYLILTASSMFLEQRLQNHLLLWSI